MDVESVAAELFGLVPAEFTAARDAYVAQARTAGDRELAVAIAGLRKPTVAAWTAGLLVRRRPREARGLVQLGEALRTAHRTLEARALRQLSHDQHVVIGELARTARALAVEAGQSVSDPVLREVEGILHAVLADADVAELWEAGRLTKAPKTVSGFAGLEPLPGAAPPRRAQAPRGSGSSVDQGRPPKADADAEEQAGQVLRESVEAARAESAEAQAEAERLEAAQAEAQEQVDSMATAVSSAEEEARAARDRLEAARSESAAAAARLREARKAAATARTHARAAARKVEKLTGSEA